uniref:Theileria-specific sub-telomeric protein, putative n=1 Tax=Theileria annulata TaxID=5874 RepID=A0A3B0N1V1_THEAN
MSDETNTTKNYNQDVEQDLNMVAYMFAGLAMMLNIRLSYSAAPFALLRFKLPENLFSVFVRTTSSALELWCLPSMLLGNVMEQVYNHTQNTTKPHTANLKTAASDMLTDAGTLHNNASLLEGAAKGTSVHDEEALKQKAGTDNEKDSPGTLRYLAKKLYEAANDLHNAMASGAAGKQEAQQLANEIGQEEGPDGKLRHALAKLAGGTGQAGAVTGAYSQVQSKFQQVERQQTTYKSKGKQTLYKAVVEAWNAFKNVYNADLKRLAEALRDAVGESDEAELRKALKDLNNNGGDDKATEVIQKYNDVADKYKAVKALETTYKAITGIKSQYEGVESKFTELQTKYSKAIYQYKWHLLTMPSIITNWLNFLTFVILFIVYISGGDQGSVTGYYWVMAISGFVFGINMVLVYAVDYRYLPYYIAGENSFPIVTSAILYFTTSIFGNRRKYNSDYLVVLIDISISIAIALVAAILWTKAFWEYRAPKADRDSPKAEVISPALLVLVGMGLVYSIYPGIAPGMIVPFYLIDKIEMVLLILTTFPPLIFAFTTKYAPNWSPKTKFLLTTFSFGGWKEYEDNGKVYGWLWHFFDILAPLQIILAVIFIYSIHYRDSSISRSIVNQPKMSTFLTIIFYMCHEIMLATGFPGLVCNSGVTWVLLPTQWVGALLMVFLAFYSIGYITEYKRHDPSEWPTDGMTWWNSVCYWLKMASKITNKNFKQLFTTDLRRGLIICHKEIKFPIHTNIN